jgi:hypothetical protein
LDTEHQGLPLPDLALLLTCASGLGGLWLLQGLWVSPFGATLEEIGEVPPLFDLAASGMVSWAATGLVVLLLVGAVRARSRLLLAAATLVPAITIVALVQAVTSVVTAISPALTL